MADDTFVEFTQCGDRSEWKAHLRWSSAACANFSLQASGPDLRYLKQGLDRWLVIGEPRPERAPATADGEPDPAHALVLAVARRGQSALRHTEGGWALLHWDAGAGELLLAVDRLARCNIHFQLSADGVQLASHPQLLDAAQALAGDPASAIERLAPGSHVRFSSDGTRHSGFHGSWREARADRRPWPLILGEFEERLKSVLRLLGESADLVILIEQTAASAMLASLLRHLPGTQASLLWVPGWSQGDRALWSAVAVQCGLDFIDASEAGADCAGDALLARAAQQLCPRGALRARPMRLLSGAGFDLLLPGGAPLWRRLLSRTPWVVQDERRASQMGSALAARFATQWQAPLENALAASALRAAWPILDETVALFLVNLPPRLREGGSWRGDFRSSVLRSIVPAPLRRALKTVA